MAEFESLSRGWDHLGNIERTLGDLQGSLTAIYELVQNADDAPGATRMRFVVTDDAIEVWNHGIFERCSDVTSAKCEWLAPPKHRCDLHSFREMASGDKRNRPGTTGAFGVGFTAVYQFTDRPELFSNGEHWIVDEMAAEQDKSHRLSPVADPDARVRHAPQGCCGCGASLADAEVVSTESRQVFDIPEPSNIGFGTCTTLGCGLGKG